jgi:dTDP-glucose pyrophosphorylase
MKTSYLQNTIYSSQTIKEALVRLDNLGEKSNLTLFVLNTQKQLIGSLTDGDIRRGLLNNQSINDAIESVMNTDFKYLEINNFTIKQIQDLKIKEIRLVPILNSSKEIVRIIDLSKKKSVLPIDVVIMAGGEGKRLLPLTANRPKPLLKVGEKPILEHNIDRLDSYGVNMFFISINYLGEQLIDYFGNGNSKGISINYIQEESPQGTIGAVSLINNFSHDSVLIMNSDLLTDIDYEDFYKTFIEKDSDLMVVTVPYRVSIPYGILETRDENITGLKEKPTYTYHANAGMYMVKKQFLDLIPKNGIYNATTFIETMIQKKAKVSYYSLLNYWLDIGIMADFKKAQNDIQHLKI